MEIKEEELSNPETNTSEETQQVPPISLSVSDEEINNFRPVYQRYYETRYCNTYTTPSQNLDTCIRMHSNKISMIYLSPNHEIFKTRNRKIQKINFQITPKLNRLNFKLSGKGKRGAQYLSPESILCFIETEQGDVYTVRSGLYGKLIEINEDIIDNPNLIMEDLFSRGYIAIVLQDLKKFETNMNALLVEDDYFQIKKKDEEVHYNVEV